MYKMSVVNFKHSYIFFHEPHCGGRSITQALTQQEGSFDFNGDHHISPSNMIHGKYVTREQFDGFTKFRFIRNPYDYLVTAWIVYNKKRMPFNKWVFGPGTSHMLNGTLFWRYNEVADFNLRFENLVHDLNSLLSAIGAPRVDLPVIGKIENKPRWQVLLTDTEILGLEDIYPDICRFGYNLERAV